MLTIQPISSSPIGLSQFKSAQRGIAESADALPVQKIAPVSREAPTKSKGIGSLESQINSQIATAGPDAQVEVQYQYAIGADGELLPVRATVTITEERPAEQAQAGQANGSAERTVPSGQVAINGGAGIQDVISINPNKEQENAFAEGYGLSDGERALLRQLQASDVSVRRHEGLHFRAAGGLASPPSYQTVEGPDGNFYAVGGSVGVSGTRGADPERRAREAQTLAIAATAPGDASQQDNIAARKFNSQAAEVPDIPGVEGESAIPDPSTKDNSAKDSSTKDNSTIDDSTAQPTFSRAEKTDTVYGAEQKNPTGTGLFLDLII